MPIEKPPTFAELFCGGGGSTEGAIAAGYRGLWAVEYDKHAAAIYRSRFPEIKLIQSDIRSLSDEFIQSLAVPDILLFGFPCPDFSMAGKRAGIEGTRGNLFFEAIRFLRLLQPRYFLAENVQGLLSSNGGEDFLKILEEFAQLGYVGSWQLRNGLRHVPQNRPRIFFLGMRGGCKSYPASAGKKELIGVR